MHIVCAGHCNWDVRLRVDRLPSPDSEVRITRRRESGGGSAANVAVGLAELDRTVHFLGAVGDDEHGTSAVDRLERAGVVSHVRVAETLPTTTKYILVDDAGQIALLGTDGANEAFTATDIHGSILESAAALHLTGQDPATAVELARAGRAADAVVSFDPGRRVSEREYGPVFEYVDVLFVNEREAAAVDADVPMTVRKHGADGASLSGSEGIFTHPGFDIGTATDTTGAGDAFAAGFLSAWLKDRDPARALEKANACGALAASEEGPGANLSRERVEALRRS